MADDTLVNVTDPNTGEVGSAPQAQLQDLLAKGYTQSTPDETNQAVYGSPLQTTIAGGEALGRGVTGPVFTAAERALGVPGEDILGRESAHPILRTALETAGLVGGSFIPGLGEETLGAHLAQAGHAATEALGGAQELGSIGALAAHTATETALYQAQDEATKFIAGDPNQSMGSAMMDVGLSGLLGAGGGAALGAISPIWKATVGDKLAQAMQAFKGKGDIAGLTSDPVNTAVETLGMEIAPEVRAALSKDEWAQRAMNELNQTDTASAGREVQQSLKDFRSQGAEQVVNAMGRTAEDVANLGETSKYEVGKSLGETAADEYEKKVAPHAAEFEALSDKYGDAELTPDQQVKTYDQSNPYQPKTVVKTVPGTVSEIANAIGKLAMDQGWTTSPSSEIMQKVNQVLKELPLQKNVDNLTKFISETGKNFNSDIMNRELSRAGSIVQGAMRDGMEKVIGTKLADEAPELVARYNAARAGYRQAALVKDAIDARLRIGGTVGGFAKNLRDMALTDGEKILQRISGTGSADTLSTLTEHFPETAKVLKDYHVDNILKTAAQKAGPDQLINSKALLSSIEKMSPEMRQFAFEPGAVDKVHALGTLLEQLEKLPYNFSNTARTMDKLLQGMPGNLTAMLAALTGHNPVIGFALGKVGEYAAREIPASVKLAMLKFMGSNGEISSAGFKAAVDYADAVARGIKTVDKGVKAVFEGGPKVIAGLIPPSTKDREKLDQKLQDLRDNPHKMMETGGHIGTYLPEHASAIGQTTSSSVAYLNSLRPSTQKMSPLDKTPKPSAMQQATYDRQLEIAASPATILNHIKNGTLIPQDLMTLSHVAPGAYPMIQKKLTDAMVNHLTKEKAIPYETRMGLSLFMGHPLDSTMTPNSIQSAQMVFAPPSMPPQAPSKQPHSMKQLKFGQMDALPGQARELARSSQH